MFTPPIFDGECWGPWRFDARLLTITHEDTGYEIDLEELTTSARLLDCIFQTRNKTWCSCEDAGALLAALQELLDPQANLCSWGVDKCLEPPAYISQLLSR